MRFTHPLYLLLLIPLIGAWLYSYRHVHGMATGRKRLAFVLRLLLIFGVVGALAGPEARRPNVGLCTIFVVDRSDSIGEKDRQTEESFVHEALGHLGQSDVAGIIAFGKDAAIDAAPGGRRDVGRILTRVDGTASDLASAIRLASATFPEGKARRIVLLTDGDETKGDVAQAAEVAASDGIVIDHVALGLHERVGEASVASVEIPSEVRQQQPFDLHVLVDSTVPQNAELDIDRDGVLVKRMPVKLTSGRNSLIVSQTLGDTGFHRFRATLHAEKDLDDRNNVGLGFVAVRGKPRILILQETVARTALADALRKAGIAADVLGKTAVPTRAEQLQVYDAVILNDINADAFTPDQMKLFQAAVRDSGIGLAMIGGENSFLPGGYYGSPIAEALPVDLNIRQRKTFPSTSVAIMIDASGSMGMEEDGFPKIRLAGKAAEETVKMLSPQDRVGVAGSTDGIEFVAPMQPLTDKASVISQIQKLYVGGGGIYAQPSMLKGEEVLGRENTQVRHFILLADGNDVDTQEGCLEIAARMRLNKITTSVVAIGDGKDVGFLKNLATIGGGKFYLADKASKLPAIMTEDTSIISRSAIEEGAFLPKMVLGQEILKGFEDAGFPPLMAYCLTDSRPLSSVAMKTHKDDPLLATWQYGLGTSMAFTSDAQPRWASKWVGWPGFGTFWSQAVRLISRRATLNNYQVAVHEDGAKGRVDVKAFDKLGNPLASSNAVIRVSLPDGSYREVNLDQQAPGAYTGSFDASKLGTYIVTVAEPDGSGGRRTSATGYSVPYPAEYRTYKANLPLLNRVAKMTGGIQVTKWEQSLRPMPNPGVSITELWPSLLFLAALLLPVDVGVRRLALPLGELLAKVTERLRSSRPEKAAAPVAVDRLHKAKERAQVPTTVERTQALIVDKSPEMKPTNDSTKGAATKPDQTPTSTAQSLLESKRRREK